MFFKMEIVISTLFTLKFLKRFKDKMLGKRVYVIFPMYRKNTEDGVIIAVDEILNKGIHPENDHSCGIPLGRKYVGRKCITILQEG